MKFPALEGVTTPQHPRVARRLDFGPEFESRGVILQEPPKVTGAFPVLVPQVDADGIDLGGMRLPEVSVPLATMTGWNLRSAQRGAPDGNRGVLRIDIPAGENQGAARGGARSAAFPSRNATPAARTT